MTAFGLMPFLRRLACCATLLAAGTTACVFDQDAEFTPQYVASYVVVEAADGTRALWQVTDTGVNPDVQTALGLAGAVQAVAVKGQRLYVATDQTVSAYDAQSLSRLAQVQVGTGLRALVPGDDWLLALDSAGRTAHYLPLGLTVGERYQVPLDFAPTLGASANGKFVVAGGTDAAFLSETGVALLRTTSFAVAPQRLSLTNVFSVAATARNAAGNLVVMGVDLQREVVGNPTLFPALLDQRVSPFARQQYGGEYLQAVSLVATTRRLDVPAFPDTTRSYDVDFQRGRVLYVSRDSLLRYDIATQTRLGGAGVAGGLRIRAAVHVYDRP